MRVFTFILLAFIFWTCSNDGVGGDWVQKDLMKYNVPIKVMAPDSSVVEVRTYADQKDVTIKGKDNYSIQLFQRKKTGDNLTASVDELKSLIEQSRYFSELIKEYPDGFIYKLQIDSTFEKFGFRRVKIQGNNEYVVQPGMMSNYTLEEIEQLYGILDIKK